MENKPQHITGLVLCGGESTRLGQPKFLLEYHDKPQFHYLYDLLMEYTSETVISGSGLQQDQVDSSFYYIKDEPEFADAGPLTGILSVSKKYPDDDLLVLACDYPNIHTEVMLDFVMQIVPGDLLLFRKKDSSFIETVLGYYPLQFIQQLKSFYQTGGRSIQELIRNRAVQTFTPADPDVLININTADELASYRAKK
jgi:molybdopterin-guanine dinucleotide biosynthesis protein A